MERRTLDAYRDRVTRGEDRPVQPGGGGGAGSPVQLARVTGWGTSNRWFICRSLDEAGQLTGPAFPVYACSRSNLDNDNLGEAVLSGCHPNYRVGSLIRIQRQRNFIALPPGATLQWVDDWFAVDTFTQFCVV